MTGGAGFIDAFSVCLAAFFLQFLWGSGRFGVRGALRLTRFLRDEWPQKTQLAPGRRLISGTLHSPKPLWSSQGHPVLFHRTAVTVRDEIDSETIEIRARESEERTAPCVLRTSEGDVSLPATSLRALWHGSYEVEVREMTDKELAQVAPALAAAHPPTEFRTYHFSETVIRQDSPVHIIGDFAVGPGLDVAAAPSPGEPIGLPVCVRLIRLYDTNPAEELGWDGSFLFFGIGSTLLLTAYAVTLVIQLLR